jgi:predicted AAA+ superfamily ATPase
MEIKRGLYLHKLLNARQNNLVKVVTGPRRCGKTYLLTHLFHSKLKEEGVSDDHIIIISMEDRRNRKLTDPDAFLDHVDTLTNSKDLFYIIIDEVQQIKEFTDVLNTLLLRSNLDIYVSGSNSHFLSSDIATEFRGRDFQIQMHPLSFAEFYSAMGGSREETWRQYWIYGGLPNLFSFHTDEEKTQYLQGIYNTVYLADIKNRYAIRHDQDLESLIKIIASGIGAPFNPTRLVNTFKSVENVTVSRPTIEHYLSYLIDAFLVSKAERYDVKGRKYIGTLAKYYFEDVGLRNSLIGFKQLEETHIMENVVYNELKIRGFQVDVGNVDVVGKTKEGKSVRSQLEIDFVANKGSRRYYIQVAYAVPGKDKMKQETRSLLSVKDAFKKILIVKENTLPWHTDDGIAVIGLMDFLLNPDSLEL